MSGFNIDEIIDRMELLRSDHEPDGWPAVQMKDITSLCIAIDKLVPAIDRLQEFLEEGAEIKYQDKEWHLFAKDGNGICSGKTIRKMLINLIFIDNGGLS